MTKDPAAKVTMEKIAHIYFICKNVKAELKLISQAASKEHLLM